ncbi:hypothetical protein C5952_19455 [Cronobacter sakazakii]|nr:hypothetical protein [Cronobacter sakazakii]EGT4261328.1 hypothetical protein [Cronobacter sakazakii]EGT4271777.1 hypothetical protein [Cronobacter sakazakii]EGT4302626.1 hypothetical protein [Cronobacter sakazakii]EGT4331083.1 hypothetical protein [Cronobacter sakazakii]
MVGALRLPTLRAVLLLLWWVRCAYPPYLTHTFCCVGRVSAAHPPCQITPHAFLPLYNLCAFPRHEAFSTSLKNTHIK